MLKDMIRRVATEYRLAQLDRTAEEHDCYRDYRSGGLSWAEYQACLRRMRYTPRPREYRSFAAPYWDWARIAELKGEEEDYEELIEIRLYALKHGKIPPQKEGLLQRLQLKYRKELENPKRSIKLLEKKKEKVDLEIKRRERINLEEISSLATQVSPDWEDREVGDYRVEMVYYLEKFPYYAELDAGESSYGSKDIKVSVSYFTGEPPYNRKDRRVIFEGKVDFGFPEIKWEYVNHGGGRKMPTLESYRLFGKEKKLQADRAKLFAQGLILADSKGLPLPKPPKYREVFEDLSKEEEELPEAPEVPKERLDFVEDRQAKMLAILDIMIDRMPSVTMLKGFRGDLERGKGLTEDQLRAIRANLYKLRMKDEADLFRP